MRTMHAALLLALAATAAITGCSAPLGAEGMLDVVLPQEQRRTADAGTGPELLASSAWAIFRVAEEGESAALVDQPPAGPYGGLLNGGILARPPADVQMFRAGFGAGGAMTDVRENKFLLAEFYGESLSIDGEWHAAPLPGLRYRPLSFGVSDNDQFALAITVEVQFLGMPAGSAVLYSWGTVDGDRLDGTFGYRLDFSSGIGRLFLTSGGDQYPVYGTRVED